MSEMRLEERDQSILRGKEGAARRSAMELVVEMARALQAPGLIDIESAHIDGCLPFGEVALDLPMRLIEDGGAVAVPTTLNVAALDLLHPDRPTGDRAIADLGRRIAAAYEALGCRPTWTCAPYQLSERPSFGSHVAWAESNAIVFANSVLGARTSRYGDLFDICAALTGRVPEAGLHVTDNRRGRTVFRLEDLTDEQLRSDLLYPLLGAHIGQRTGSLIPVIVGLPDTASEDQLKALGAAAASAGSVAMFHAVGITPEAPTLSDALHGERPAVELAVASSELRAVRATLRTATTDSLSAIAVGTPHFSLAEFEELVRLLDDRAVHPSVHFYASTGRETYQRISASGTAAALESQGVAIITDTCTYLRPMLDFGTGVVLTNSAKWAWYAPMAVGVDVALGSLAECVDSAISGRLELNDGF
jgi:predicted aconitase